MVYRRCMTHSQFTCSSDNVVFELYFCIKFEERLRLSDDHVFINLASMGLRHEGDRWYKVTWKLAFELYFESNKHTACEQRAITLHLS